MAGWDTLENLIYEEVIQRGEEGCDVTGLHEKVTGCEGSKERLMEVYLQLCTLKIRSGYEFREPTVLSKILSLSEGNTPDEGFHGTKEELNDRLKGAWLGRCIGCALGKPFETDPYVSGQDGKAGFEYIKFWLEGADAWPLKDYVPGTSKAAEENLQVIAPSSQLGNIEFMETDDDIRYLVIGLIMSERYGNNFNPDKIASMWKEYLPANQCCTAERQAYINALNAEISDETKRWEYYRNWLNPYREWIGAQIRVDHYAYVNAGFPLTAAKIAYQDAAFSHVKNGIYGAMFTAAVIANAFTDSDPISCVNVGLSVIPKTSRLYADIKKAVEFAKNSKTQEELFKQLWEEYGHYNWVHTNNNAAACAAALAFGKGDFTDALSAAVCCGWDTDCNGATVGSIMGAMHGANAIPEHWKLPLNDTLYSFIPGFHPISISECARRSEKVFWNIHS